MFTIKGFIDFMSNGKELIYIKITWFRTGLARRNLFVCNENLQLAVLKILPQIISRTQDRNFPKVFYYLSYETTSAFFHLDGNFPLLIEDRKIT